MWPTHSAYQPHTIQVWGIVAFILVRSFHNLQQINEINSTLSFCEYPTIEELYGFELQ